MISAGDHSKKPGFIRISLHPTMTDEELEVIIDAIKQIAKNHEEWAKDYRYNTISNEFYHHQEEDRDEQIKEWFSFG